jgi:hypothetical protein
MQYVPEAAPVRQHPGSKPKQVIPAATPKSTIVHAARPKARRN